MNGLAPRISLPWIGRRFAGVAAAIGAALCAASAAGPEWNLPAGERPGYLIVCPQLLIDANTFDDFVEFKRGLGFKVYGVSIETIEASMPGRDRPEKVREYLKRAYGSGTALPINNVRYVLLVGGHEMIPFREVYARWRPPSETGGVSHTDWYYADLTGDWDSNKNDLFGQGLLLDQPTDAADLHHEVAVGRLPFWDHPSVDYALLKIIAAESDGGAWKQRTLGMGAFMELARQEWTNAVEGGYYLDRGADTDNAVLMERIWQETWEPLGMTLTRVYETNANPNGESPSAYAADYDLQSATAAWTAAGGYGLVNLAGHGSAGGIYRHYWQDDPNTNHLPDQPTEPLDAGGGQMVSYNEIDGSSKFLDGETVRHLWLREGIAPVVVAAGCTTADFSNPDNLGANFLKLGKASAYMGSLATTGYKGGWTANTGEAVMQDVSLRFNRLLLTDYPRVGDALFTTLMQLFDEADGEPRGRALVRDVLYGDPAMSYWGNAAAYAGPWPMFRHDIRNTGFTTNAGPANGRIRWTFPIAPVPLGKAIPSPIVSAYGTIYVGSESGRLHAVTPGGQELWHFDAGGAINAGPILTVSGNLYFRADDGYLYAVRAGELLWRVPVAWTTSLPEPTPLYPPFCNSPRVSPDGTVLAMAAHAHGAGQSKSIHTYRPTGQDWILQEWDDYGAAGTPALAPDGTFYIVDWGGNLRAFGPDLSERGEFSLTNSPALGSPAIGSDGTVYFGDTSGQFYAVRPDMTYIWYVTLPYADSQINSSPAIGEDGTVYFGSRNHRVYGKTRYNWWQFDTGGPVDSSPALDPTTVYIVGGSNGAAKVFALNRATGAERWSVPIGGNSLWGSSPAIGLDHVLYVVSSVGQLIAIEESGPEPAPNDVNAEALAPDRALVSWRNNGDGMSTFHLERRHSLSNDFVDVDIGTNQTSFLDTGLEPNTRYVYRVHAVMPYPSGYSEEARVRTPRPVPNAPIGLTAAADSAYGIRLNWSGVDPNTLAVAIYRAPAAAGPFTEIGLALDGVHGYLDLNPRAEWNPQPVGGDPRPGQTYYYQLRAFNDTGESAATAPVPGATRGLSLPAPTAVTVETLSSSRVRIHWESLLTDPGIGFVVERSSEQEAGYEVVATLPGGARSYEDVIYSDPGWCSYRVRAVNATDDSPFAVASPRYVVGRLVPADLRASGLLEDGSVRFRVTGDGGIGCAVEVSSNLVDWLPMMTTTIVNGSVDLTDTNAPARDRQFYRAVVGP